MVDDEIEFQQQDGFNIKEEKKRRVHPESAI